VTFGVVEIHFWGCGEKGEESDEAEQ